jgi:hypothetical protein
MRWIAIADDFQGQSAGCRAADTTLVTVYRSLGTAPSGSPMILSRVEYILLVSTVIYVTTNHTYLLVATVEHRIRLQCTECVR